MGNCLPLPDAPSNEAEDLPIRTAFEFPSPTPTWPPGGEFARGSINLGGLEVCQVNTFTKVWATNGGGQDNLGATFFRPSPIPSGFFMLGGYCQPNNKPLFGWVLVGKDVNNASSDLSSSLAKPVDYTLLWSSESKGNAQDGNGYIWLPIAPEGYVAVGLTVTSSSEKPSLDEIRCVRSDLTDACETDAWIWGNNVTSSSSNFNVYTARPTNRGTQELGVNVGTFIAYLEGNDSTPSIACLKNNTSNFSAMPDLNQIHALLQTYSPWVYFHPDETYLPSSVSWFFDNEVLLYNQTEPTPIPVDSTGSNLPLGGSNDGAYWLDLPVDESAKEHVKRGNVKSCKCYIHVKPMLGATFTDIAIWLFYPFNGSARARVVLVDVDLGRIGEHVGDWEHVTLRVSNFNGVLWKVYFSQHSSGQWVDAAELEFEGGNKPAAYSSFHGHAFYPKAGLVLQGSSQLEIGLRNDTAKGEYSLDTGAAFELVAAAHLDSVVGPPWLDYAREWGPTITYDYAEELQKVVESLPENLQSALESLGAVIPDEVFGESGPTGPKMKSSWSGDER